MRCRLSATILFAIMATAVLAGPVAGEWEFTGVSIDPMEPDHERTTLFKVRMVFRGGTGNGQQTGDNGTGNGTGTGLNGTGNQTVNSTVNITSVEMVTGGGPDWTGPGESRHMMSRANGTDEFSILLGPWAPGEELPFHFEAAMSNGSVLVSNESWLRTPNVLAFRWHDSFSEAARLAASLGRPLLVFVYSNMDRTIEYMLPDRAEPWRSGPFCHRTAVALSPSFVCLRVDADIDPALAARFGAKGTPCIVFFNATSNRTIERVTGPFGNATLVDEMRYVLGTGPKPSKPGPFVADVVAQTVILAVTLTAGSVLMLYYYLMKKRGR